MPLNPSSKCFTLVTLLSALEFLFGFFLGFFFIDIYILFIYHFLGSTSFFSSLSIFWTAVSKSLIDPPSVLFQGQFLLIYFFPLNEPYFPFLLCLMIFFLENRIFESNNIVTLDVRFSPFPRVCFFCLFVLFFIIVDCLIKMEWSRFNKLLHTKCLVQSWGKVMTL